MKLELIDRHIHTSKGEWLVKGVSLTIEAGSVLALVGASGSGKSLTCSSLFDVLPNQLIVEGEMRLNGELTSGRELRGRQMACIMQNPSSAFNPVQTMAQHCQESLIAAGVKAPNVVKQAMLDAGLEDWQRVLKLYPFQMSGGMLQRMMLALALMSQAPILIADEPTTDLDLVVQKHILTRLKQVVEERDLALLMVTHDLGVVAELADRVAIMHQGELVETTSVHKLFRSPQHPISKTFIQAHLALYEE